MKRCAGPCGRELPADDEHFYRQHPRGLTPRCRECVKASQRARKAERAEHRKESAKRCIGPCGRELPRDDFARDPLDRPRPRCRECELAADLAADIERRPAHEPPPDGHKQCPGPCGRTLPLDAEHFHHQARSRDGFQARCKDCINAEHRERRRAAVPPPDSHKRCCGPCGRTLPLDAAHWHRHVGSCDGFQARCKDCLNAQNRERRDAEREARRPPPAPNENRRRPLGFATDREVRFRFVQEYAERNPRDPTRAERARQIIRAGDEAVAALCEPPFDANELFLTMAEGAGDVGALGAALRRIGWRPQEYDLSHG